MLITTPNENSNLESSNRFSFKKAVFVLLLIAILIVGYFLYAINSKASSSSDKVNFVVTSGQGLKAISLNLEKNGLVKHRIAFEVYEYLTGKHTKIQAGVYELSKNMSAIQLSGVLQDSAKSVYDVKRVREGATLKDVADDFYGTGNSMEKTLFVAALAARAQTYDFLGEKPVTKSLEGYLFPDTYFFAKDAKPADIINKILDNTSKKITPEIRQDIKSQNRKIFDVITLASIVEKEVGRNTANLSATDLRKLQEERETVAGIFINRLAIGMPLQSDATVTYITQKKDPSASLEDTKIDSPYNTYKYKGLPPGPIGNPSISAILAATDYIKTDYLYFLTDKSGVAYYAKTLDEHNANKAKYLGQ